jgi:hypothetical protein
LSALLTLKTAPGKRPAGTPAGLNKLQARLSQPQDLSSTELLKEINALSIARGVGNERPLQ